MCRSEIISPFFSMFISLDVSDLEKQLLFTAIVLTNTMVKSANILHYCCRGSSSCRRCCRRTRPWCWAGRGLKTTKEASRASKENQRQIRFDINFMARLPTLCYFKYRKQYFKDKFWRIWLRAETLGSFARTSRGTWLHSVQFWGLLWNRALICQGSE